MSGSSTSVPTLGVTILDAWGTYTEPIIRAVAAAARARGARVRFFVGRPPADLLARLSGFNSECRIDGLIAAGPEVLVGGGLPWPAGEKPPLPVVGLAALLDGAPAVLSDNRGGLKAAVQHLAALGRRRIAFVRGPLGNHDAEERLRGFREGLEQCGLELDPALVAPGAFAEASGVQAVRLFVDDRGAKFDAIIGANDTTACGVVSALQRRGLRVPEDVSVVGFDGFLESLACEPPLTTLRQPIEEMGAKAVELLLAQIAGQSVPPRVTLPNELVVRRSCGGRATSRETRRAAEVTQGDVEIAQARSFLDASRREVELGGLTLSMLAAATIHNLLAAIREFRGILSLKNLHLTVLDEDPGWARLMLSTVLGDEMVRFRSDQLLPQGALGSPDCAFLFELRRDCPLGRLVLECDAEHPRSLHFLAFRIAAVLQRLKNQGALDVFAMRDHSVTIAREPLTVGPYRVMRRIAQSDLATVYLAERDQMENVHRRVALKVINPKVVNFRSGSVFQLMEEVRVAAMVQHPNVVVAFDALFHESSLCVAMDYVEGDTLAGLMSRAERVGERIPVPIVGRILTDVLEGLHAAHESKSPDGLALGLVHRDLSPQNILVGSDGVSRVTDFGLARTPTSGSSGSVPPKGRARHMAPEQALGMPLDRRCDLWATGMIFWETLAGRQLQSKQMDVAALLTLISDPPPSLRTVRPEVPEAVEHVIERVLRVDAAERFCTAAEFRAAAVEAWNTCSGIADVDTTAHFVQDLVARTTEDGESDAILTRIGA